MLVVIWTTLCLFLVACADISATPPSNGMSSDTVLELVDLTHEVRRPFDELTYKEQLSIRGFHRALTLIPAAWTVERLTAFGFNDRGWL